MADEKEIREQPAHRSSSIALKTTDDVNHIEAPVTWKAYLMCAFASFGGIFLYVWTGPSTDE
jgi:hypothetical protein